MRWMTIGIAAAGIGTAALAQDLDATGEPDEAGESIGAIESTDGDRPDWDELLDIWIEPRTRYTFGTDLEDGNGDVSVWRAGGDVGVGFPISEDARITFGVGYEYSHYNFDRPNAFLAGTSDPFDDIHILDARLNGYFRVDEDDSIFAGVSGRVAGDADVDIDDAGTIGGRIGWRRQFSDDVAVGLGVFATTRIEDDALILPAVSVDWRLHERWRVSVDGTRGELIHDLDDDLELAFGAAWENRRFRLDDDPIADSAVVEDTAVPIFARLGYRPDDSGLRFDLIGGVIVAQEFEIADRHGDNEREFESDPTPFVGFALRWTF